MTLSAGTRLGPYEISAPIGAGGMGEVYRARDTKLNRDVALKILPDGFSLDGDRIARFRREAQVLASLNHPNIAAIYGFEDSGSTHALVLELVEGPTLADRIAKGAIPLDEALPIAKQIAEALEAAHEQGIIHRDLKPANIKVRDDGTVKVLDFGLAKAMEPASAISPQFTASPTITTPAQMTGVGMMLGTAAYMSPEQAKGRPADKRSDVWAFGCVLYEMLTAKRAFEGEDVSDTLAAVLRAEPEWTALANSTPPPIRVILRRCLQKDQRARMSDVSTARLVIEELASITTDDVLSDAGARRLSTVKRALLVVGSVIVAVILSVALLVWSRSTVAEQPGVVRTSLQALPDNSITAIAPAISPDGRVVAFVGRSPQGPQLYIRRLDDWDARAISGSAGANNPFFSPDGEWVAFQANRNLYKVPSRGGAVQRICATDSAYRGEWTSDGKILFATWPNAGLWLVASDGGVPQLLAQPKEAGGSVWYLWPRYLPGQRTVLFTQLNNGHLSVVTIAPGETTPRVLVDGGSEARYVSSGHLLYRAEGRLFAASFDPERLSIRGGAMVIAEEFSDTALQATYDVSRDGNLVYSTASTLTYTLAWVDRHGKITSLPTHAGAYSAPRLSPDGTRFSVVVNDGPLRNIWVGQVTGGPLSRLTFGNDDVYGVWSPDGKRLYYTSGQRGRYNLFATTTDGSAQVEQLTDSPDPQQATSISRNGDVLLFHDAVGGRIDLWQYSLSRKEAKPFIKTQFSELNPAFSPDGHAIAYASDESGRTEVYVQSYPDARVRRQVSIDGGNAPEWSHSGQELFFVSQKGVVVAQLLDVKKLQFGEPVLLFTPPVSGALRPQPSSDDQRFLLTQPASVGSTSSQLNLVLNWFEELKQRVPAK